MSVANGVTEQHGLNQQGYREHDMIEWWSMCVNVVLMLPPQLLRVASMLPVFIWVPAASAQVTEDNANRHIYIYVCAGKLVRFLCQ